MCRPADRSPPEPGLVHHVVVVEAGHVGQLHHHGRAHDVVEDRAPGRTDGRIIGRPELRGQHHQQWPEPFPAGGDDVPGRLRHHR
jgi:hypothetical protein